MKCISSKPFNCKYDYLTGRFTSTVSLWEKYLGLTPYQYAWNNPVNWLDEYGKKMLEKTDAFCNEAKEKGK